MVSLLPSLSLILFPVLCPALPLPFIAHTSARMISRSNLARLLLCLKDFRVPPCFQEGDQGSYHSPSLLSQVFHIPPQFLYFEHNIFSKNARLFETSIF